MDATPVFIFVIGMAVCLGASVLLIVGGGFLIFYLGKKVVAPMRQRQLEAAVEDWADDHGYELLEITEVESRDHPFADRFGFGFGKTPGVVKCVEMRNRKGRIRRGWIFVRARFTG